MNDELDMHAHVDHKALARFNEGVEAARREYDADPLAAARHSAVMAAHMSYRRDQITLAELRDALREIRGWDR